jgi:hypothetical protein
LSRRPVSHVALAVVLKAVLDRITREPAAAAPAPRRRAATRDSPRPPERSRALLLFTFACLGVALVLMVVFHATVTRIFGVVALFAFIVSGVFLIASPEFLGPEQDQAPLRGRDRG